MRVVLLLTLMLGGCTTAGLVPAGGYQPIGFSTYGQTPDGNPVRLWTDYNTMTTTGTIGGQSVRFKSY